MSYYDYDKPLFDNQPIENLLAGAKLGIATTLSADTTKRITMNLSMDVSPEALLKKYSISIPTIEQPKARVDKNTGEVEYIIPYKGEAVFFHLSPKARILTPRPVATVISDCFYMRMEAKDDAADIKAEFQERYKHFNEWFEVVKAEAEAFNEDLPGIIQHLIDEQNKTVEQNKSLEDELNSSVQ